MQQVLGVAEGDSGNFVMEIHVLGKTGFAFSTEFIIVPVHFSGVDRTIDHGLDGCLPRAEGCNEILSHIDDFVGPRAFYSGVMFHTVLRKGVRTSGRARFDGVGCKLGHTKTVQEGAQFSVPEFVGEVDVTLVVEELGLLASLKLENILCFNLVKSAFDKGEGINRVISRRIPNNAESVELIGGHIDIFIFYRKTVHLYTPAIRFAEKATTSKS